MHGVSGRNKPHDLHLGERLFLLQNPWTGWVGSESDGGPDACKAGSLSSEFSFSNLLLKGALPEPQENE